MSRRITRTGLFCWLGLSLAACAAARPMSYSLEDSEIFVAPRPHFLNLAVAVMEDGRSSEEKAWASRFQLPSDLSDSVSDRIVRHLRASSVFSQVETMPGPVDPNSSDNIRELVSKGADVVLMGELLHYYGRNDPDRRIEGHVQFANLKLYSTHTGQLLWQGTADKLIQRQEKNPGRDDFYAVEALRGAINQLAIRLSGQTFSRAQVYPSERITMRQWRVGVLSPEDLRSPEEKSTTVRKLEGDRDYFLYSEDNEGINKPRADAVSDQWVRKLKAAKIYGSVLIITARGVTPEKLREWSEEGVDAVLASQLSRLSASVTPSYPSQSFPIWSGGMGFRPIFKATALTRLQDVQLIDTRSGQVLWKGEAEYGIDRSVKRWESPVDLLRESLSKTLDRLVNQLSQYSPSSDEK
ncbi:MAG: hypothetical protein HY283_01855 [Nitrospirae bacterium]|nr:hypothetical protein [Nitrospirota bacterium]